MPFAFADTDKNQTRKQQTKEKKLREKKKSVLDSPTAIEKKISMEEVKSFLSLRA
jgi:hypothetical protein